MHVRPTKHRRVLVAGLLVAAGVTGGAALAIGSDHQDTPDVELNPKMDMTDLYVFPSPTPGRVVLVMNSRAFLTPAQAADPVEGSFDPDLLYQFKIDNNGDFTEDRVIQVSFTGEGVGPAGPAPRPDGAARPRRDDERGRRRHTGRFGWAEHRPRLFGGHSALRRPPGRSVLHRPRGGLLHPARPEAGDRRALRALRPLRHSRRSVPPARRSTT